mmetsp:Transcript_19452/g.22085  ORF Transcript_19452/g.22085 Transcript_19452/m.22085 type:complete len:743 (-) Transcript_19452:269-2497(-)
MATQSARLNDESGWRLANMSTTQASMTQRHTLAATGKKKKYTAILDKFRAATSSARESEAELANLRSVEELEIDYRKALSLKRGDLSIIQGEVFRCTPVAATLRGIPLILKRLDCVDRRTYDLKVYECDTFMRFRGHSNIVSLYSYWSEQPNSQYTYKTLVLMFEEGILGDMLRSVVLNPVRPSNRLGLKYCCDLAKALYSIHNSNIVHAGVKPSAMYLNASNTALLGEFKKVELDSARHTHQLFSRLLIGEAMPHTLVYWAPELLQGQKYDKAIDLWALGVSLYQIITGEHPFNVEDEEMFREDVLSANVDWSRLEGFPRLQVIIENLLKVRPEQRWSADQVLSYAQFDFCVDVQRWWRGYSQRKEFGRQCRALIMVQAHIKGFITKIRYRTQRVIRRFNAAILLQSKWRAHKRRKKFMIAKRALMRCQANVLSRQVRRAFQKMKADTISCQEYLRRYLAVMWFAKIKVKQRNLETNVEDINNWIERYNMEAKDFKGHFSKNKISGPFKHFESFSSYEMAKASQNRKEKSAIPEVLAINEEIVRLREENQALQSKMVETEERATKLEQDDASLKSQLGKKYNELMPMMDEVKKNMMRVAEMVKNSYHLPLTMQHAYQYSKWDAVHEPYNVVENVLNDEESVYRSGSPVLDFTLSAGKPCFVAEVYLSPGECGPANVEIYLSNTVDKWTFMKDFKCNRDAEQMLDLPGEPVARYLRVKCINNVRGGTIVSVKQIKVRGLPQE